MPRDQKVGTDLATVVRTTDGDSTIAVRPNRVKLRFQNRGTAPAGVSFFSLTPASLDACCVVLAPGAAVDDGLGDYFEFTDTYRAVGLKFGAGTAKLAITEVSSGNLAEVAP